MARQRNLDQPLKGNPEANFATTVFIPTLSTFRALAGPSL